MTKTIWKFELPHNRTNDPRLLINLPIGAKPLTVEWDSEGKLCLWALVDPEAFKVRSIVSVYPTGAIVPNDAGEYISTFHSHPFIFHALFNPNT